ncbi:geranylgeranyl pyrophosphate synthase-like [Colletes gigas]|uniref:geranylgeranyl pyrophosphate synthase-like n=1 Tax=Colletes gigas TaxID=935657 RepID=UPI001C9B4111|nr:geranylgeranyl pyrophosphate synthase-like [Colletes gigas]
MEETKSLFYSLPGDNEDDKQILEPVVYMQKSIEQSLESKIPIAFNAWLKVPEDKFRDIVFISRTFNIFDFIYDDIQDEAGIRKNLPLTHSTYGIANTFNAAGYTMILAIQKIHAMNHPQVMEIFLEEVYNNHRAQSQKLYWRKNYICPSEASYKALVLRRIGAHFRFMVRSMQLFSNCKEDFTPLANIIALCTQISNDYFDFHYNMDIDDKRYAYDLKTGNFNFPLIHATESHPEDTQIKTILRRRTKDITVKRYCVKLLEEFGSFAYTRNVLEDLDKQARKEIERLGGNPLFEEILDKLMDLKHPHNK